jgi:hypothetical protein
MLRYLILIILSFKMYFESQSPIHWLDSISRPTVLKADTIPQDHHASMLWFLLCCQHFQISTLWINSPKRFPYFGQNILRSCVKLTQGKVVKASWDIANGTKETFFTRLPYHTYKKQVTPVPPTHVINLSCNWYEKNRNYLTPKM